MAAGLCFHFFGNELARASSMALISTKEIGLGASALTYTVAFGCPASAITLYCYTTSIKKLGTRTTFRLSSLFCLLCFSGITYLALIGMMHEELFLTQLIIVAFYAFREIYCTLLSTQLWAFIVSTLDHTSSSYIVSFSGAVSVASTIGGFCVEQIVNRYGVHGLLVSSTIAVFATITCAELAYYLHDSGYDDIYTTNNKIYTTNTTKNIQSKSIIPLAIKTTFCAANSTQLFKTNDTDNDTENENRVSGTQNRVSGMPSKTGSATSPHSLSSTSGDTNKSNTHTPHTHTNAHTNTHTNTHTSTSSTSTFQSPRAHLPKQPHQSMVAECTRLLSNPTLRILVIEAVIHQCCSNMLNIMFYDSIRINITDNNIRAMLIGRFFAFVNMFACILQCFIIPYILSQKTLPTILIYIPIIICIITTLCALSPSLIAVMLSFGTLKVIEYIIIII